MAEVKWIKITTDIFDDDKILLIESLPDADAIIVIWFKLLCLAGKQNNSGVFLMNDRIPFTETMLATIFRRKVSVVQLALETFESFGMIEVVDGVITIPNWGKHQNLDALEKKTEYMRNYMRNYRQKQKQLAESNHEEDLCKTYGKSNVSRLDKNRLDKSIDINNNTSEISAEITDSPSPAPKNGKKTREFSKDSYQYKLASWLDTKIAERMKYYKPKTEAQLQKWAYTFDLINRIDGVEWNVIRDVLAFSQDHSFWRSNILSADKFREKFAVLAELMENEDDG